MDQQNCHVFLFLIHSPVGVLPLAVIMLSESESTLKSSFKLLQSVFPDDAFLSAQNGPEIFMTDDCTSLHLALHHVYPKLVLLLCVFHLLQCKKLV